MVAGVPYGETTTYGELARSLGDGAAGRRRGGRPQLAVRHHPPCHRVVGATGRLTGYAGGLARKRALLEIEHASSLKAARVREGLLW